MHVYDIEGHGILFMSFKGRAPAAVGLVARTMARAESSSRKARAVALEPPSNSSVLSNMGSSGLLHTYSTI